MAVIILTHSGLHYGKVLLLPIYGLQKEQLSCLVEPDGEEVNHARDMNLNVLGSRYKGLLILVCASMSY